MPEQMAGTTRRLLPVQGQDHTDVRAYKGFGLNVQITRLGCRRSTSAFSSYTPQCETFARTIQGDHRKLAQMVVMWDGNSPTYVEILRKAFPVVSASRIADRRMIITGYRLADLLTRVAGN